MDIPGDEARDELIITAIMKKRSSYIRCKSEEEVVINEKKLRLCKLQLKRKLMYSSK